jgi:hypothetical protein
MKAKLIKTGNEYLLRDSEEEALAITHGSVRGRKLSHKNCDEIFGVVDVEKLAGQEVFQEYYDWGGEVFSEDYLISKRLHFIEGFNKAMELNGDKLFTLEDMLNAYMEGTNDGAQFESLMDYDSEDFDEAHEFAEEAEKEFRESLQQPTEIEVEIEMETCSMNPLDLDCDEIIERPKLDSEGCLILKKIEQ